MPKYIIKASGEREPFNIKKFKRSLTHAGASPDLIEKLIKEIRKEPKLETTQDIYRYAIKHMKKEQPGAAARYNLKEALRQLGPVGYPFEQFIAEVFKAQGFKTQVGKIIDGKCVSHEVDIVVEKKRTRYMVECKFHNRHGIKSNVKVTLYIKARFDDITAQWIENESGPELHEAWVVTNTKFTSEAIAYCECTKMRLLSWNYPLKDNLAQLIDRLGVHPITALTCLNSREKKFFIQNGLVLCKDARSYQHLFKRLQLSKKKVKQIIQESEDVCTLKA